MISVSIKKLRDGATIPTQGSPFSAGYDFYACLEEGSVTIAPGATQKIPTGIAIAIPEGYFGAVFARSGLATKQNLRPANCVGVVDSDYRGECFIFLYNDSAEDRIVSHGDRIAQLVLIPHLSVSFQEVAELDETERGEGGFGSTGK